MNKCPWCGAQKINPLGQCVNCHRFPQTNPLSTGTKTFKVQMLAFFQSGTVRNVDVPEAKLSEQPENDLHHIYYYGQNDVQPKQCCSVSMGDVIEYSDYKYLVCALGFRKLTDEEYQEYLKVECPNRSFHHLVLG